MLAPSAVLIATLLAELPLPDVTLYGVITTEAGVPVVAGDLKARVRRGGGFLEAAGAFKEAEGKVWYVLNIPLETSIGAPGPAGLAAREGDLLEALTLDGQTLELKNPAPAMAAGAVARVDATAGPVEGLVFFRGDCSPDRVLNITDPLRLLTFLFIAPGAPPCLEACDGDGTGVLNISDAVFILSHLFLGGPRPPAPGPQCGIDPTPSNLGCVNSSCTA